jgi:hypothetical protein
MGVLSLLFGSTVFEVGALTLDVLISETHNRTASITENPIEDGSIISDHIINEPYKLSIEGYVSNSHPSILSFLNIFSFEDKAKAAFDTLEELFENKELITVVTNLKVYNDMAIENLEIPKTVEDGDSLRFSMDLKEIRKVENLTVSIPVTKLGAKSSLTQGRKRLGRKTFVPPLNENAVLRASTGF